nr:hypothetical protein [uncultured Mediterranean phage uvMED]|tara:strand:+ start:455 stop:661 length:207 start_codon:yes stop_codon:yes gene_type:complete
MKHFQFTALMAETIDDRVLNSDGIEKAVSKVDVYLTANQIIDLIAQMAPHISSALKSETLFSSERYGL